MVLPLDSIISPLVLESIVGFFFSFSINLFDHGKLESHHPWESEALVPGCCLPMRDGNVQVKLSLTFLLFS